MQTIQLPEIEIGRRFVGAISWDASDAYGAEDLDLATRVIGQFRSEPGADVIATVDTVEGTLAVVEPRTLELRMTVEQTRGFQGLGCAWIDFIRLDTNVGIPFAIRWPVAQPITVL